MDNVIKNAVNKAGDSSAIQVMKRVHGGSINQSYYVETEKRRYFIKHHSNAPSRFFELEAKGLELIGKTRTIAVPEVLAYSDVKKKAFLVMEWVKGEEKLDTQTKLGQHLAALHKHSGDKHGFSEDTFIGILPQPNGLYSSWLEYYREQRLSAQLQVGIRQKRITGKRRKRMEKMLAQLGKWIPSDVQPSYLHGDLWGGNWLAGPAGEPYLIDPSFLYGDRHFELAFTELFGGFSSAFYEAYKERYQPDDYYEEAKPLYQLYYLLVHLNIFGETYGPQVDSVLRRYVGD